LLYIGIRVTPEHLQPGDLVFFRNGVIRSSMNNTYWKLVYYQARRLTREYGAQVT